MIMVDSWMIIVFPVLFSVSFFIFGWIFRGWYEEEKRNYRRK